MSRSKYRPPFSNREYWGRRYGNKGCMMADRSGSDLTDKKVTHRAERRIARETMRELVRTL